MTDHDTAWMADQLEALADGLLHDDLTPRSQGAFAWNTGEPSIFCADSHRLAWNAKVSAAMTESRNRKPMQDPVPNANAERQRRFQAKRRAKAAQQPGAKT